MSNTQTLERNHETGLSDSTPTTSSSSSSAERYKLDEFDSQPILLYKYRGRLQTTSQKDLCAWLDKDEKLRVTKKTIPRGCAYMDVKRHDLFLPDEKETYACFPNYDSSLASIKVPTLAYWARMFLGSYDKLYIVSPESSPNSSIADEESRRWTPTDTKTKWADEVDTTLGAVQENTSAL